jgi:hypothetical protein
MNNDSKNTGSTETIYLSETDTCLVNGKLITAMIKSDENKKIEGFLKTFKTFGINSR